MADHIFSFQTTYNLTDNFFQGFQNTSELFFHPEPDSPEASPPPQPVETVRNRKEKQRRQTLDRVVQMINVEDLPGREHAASYMQYKFRRN